VQVKAMLNDWDKRFPGRIENMFTAMGNIVPSHMMDKNLFPFTSIRATGVADAGGDIAFDDDESCATPSVAPVSVIRLQRDED